MCFRRMTGPVLPRIHFTNCAAEIINSRMNRWLRENSVPKKADPDLLRGLHRMMVLGYVRDGLDAGPRTRRRDVRYSVEWDGTASAVATRRRLDMLEGGVESVGGFKVVDAVLSSGCVPDLASLSTVGAFVGFTSGSGSGSMFGPRFGGRFGSGADSGIRLGSGSGSASATTSASFSPSGDEIASSSASASAGGSGQLPISVLKSDSEEEAWVGYSVPETVVRGPCCVNAKMPESSRQADVSASATAQMLVASGVFLGTARTRPEQVQARHLRDVATFNSEARLKPAFVPHCSLASGTKEVEFLRQQASRTSSTNPPN